MTMMHLKYPQKRGYFTWDELGCLARALGFQQDMFYSHIPEEYTSAESGVSLEGLIDMIDVQKYFNQAVDRTVNIHTDRWNLSVIKKSLPLLSNKILTFSELQQIRVSYQVYETGDTKGLPIEEKLLQRALKMSNRMISPLKMMHRIKHMRGKFEEKDRMQLHEFLDLLLWCELYQGTKVGPAEMNVTKEETGLLQMENFDEVLAHHDQRMANQMDSKFIEQEFKFSKERHGSKALPKDEVPVDPEIRKKQVAYHHGQYQFLKHEIDQSTMRVSNAFTGKIRDRPITAPDLTMHQAVDPSMGVSTLNPRPPSVLQAVGHLFKPSPRPVTRDDIEEAHPRPKVTEYMQPLPPVQATFGSIEDTEKSKEALKFQMETIDMKYHQLLEEDIDFMMPGFRERQANRRPATPPPPPKEKPKKEPRPSEEYLKQMAYPKLYRRAPPPSHAKTCDARHRGWHKSRVRKGQHHILAVPTFDKSPKGVMFNKLRLASQTELGRDDYIYRYTQPEQIVPDHPRPDVLARKYPRTKPKHGGPLIYIDRIPPDSARTTSTHDDRGYMADNVAATAARDVEQGQGHPQMSQRLKPAQGTEWQNFKVYGGEAEALESKEGDLDEKYKILETYTQKGPDVYPKVKQSRVNMLEQIREGEEREDADSDSRKSFTDVRYKTAPEQATRPQVARYSTAPELSFHRPRTEDSRVVLSSSNKLVEEGGKLVRTSSKASPMDWVVVSPKDTQRPESKPESQEGSPRKSAKSSSERAVTIVSPDITSFLGRIPKARDPEINQMIADVLKKDYTEQINARKNTHVGYRRLGRRMEGVVSKDLYSKLMKGLPSANTEFMLMRSNTL